MAIRCTITASGVTNEYGQALAIGTVYTPYNDDYALALISQGKATDTDDFLEERVNAPFDEVVYPLDPVGLSADGTSLVSGDGTQWLIPGANTFTASDAGTDWYRVPDVLQVAATLDSGTSTTVLVEVRTAAGVVSTALTITADTVAQVLRSSILTMEMHEFRIRRSSGTGTVTITV